MSTLRQQTPAIIATSIFWIALFVAYALFGQRHPQAQPIEIVPPETPAAETVCPESVMAETPTPAPLRVYVSGAVKSAGVYRLPPDSLVVDAIEQAGGSADNADLVAINLAHPLTDGEQIYVPTLDEAGAPPAPITRGNTTIAGSQAPDNAAPNGPIDLNTATQEELESLPGIGPAMAQRIIDGRPYSTVDDLLNVKGIGDAKLEKIRPYVTVQ